MKSKNKFLVLISVFIVIGLVISMPSVKGTVKQRKKLTIADKDTYVDTVNPSSNYGSAIYLRCGFGIFNDIREAYFHFSFSDKPSNITKAELSLDIWGVSQTMVFTMSIIDVGWNEFTMNWTNKPPYGQIIGQFTVPSSDIYKNDITSLVTPRTEISICVNVTIDNSVDDYVCITSREGSSTDAPQIIWTYLVDVPESPAIPSYSVFIIIGIIGAIGIFLTKKIKGKEVLILKL
ncbi:MAG: DNRLRE domain-containing protein [Promethearchaeota archaeon]